MATDPNLIRTFDATPERVLAFRVALASHDIDCPEGNSGVIKPGWGVVIKFDFDGFSTLTLTLLKTGWASEDEIWNKIQNYLD